jgi:hypothetical protein
MPSLSASTRVFDVKLGSAVIVVRLDLAAASEEVFLAMLAPTRCRHALSPDILDTQAASRNYIAMGWW